MKLKIFLSLFFMVWFISNSLAIKTAGYKDAKGNYKWFDNETDSLFVDSNHHTWLKITNNKDKWNKAIIIRNANIYALLDLGFDTLGVLNDVQLLNENSILFTHFSKLANFENYIIQWKNAFNSNNFKFNARQSAQISKTGLKLKFYYKKANVNNAAALGLVKGGFFRHVNEVKWELYKKYKSKLNKATFDSYLKNYMHLNNAIELLNEKKLAMDLQLEK